MWRCKQCGKWFHAEGEPHDCETVMLVCSECGEKFAQTGPKTCYCSEECRELGERRKARERQRHHRQQQKAVEVLRAYSERQREKAVEVQRACMERQRDNAAAKQGIPDPYDGQMLYFDGLHPFRESMTGRLPDPVLGF